MHIRMRAYKMMASKVNCVVYAASQDKPLTAWKTFDLTAPCRTFRECFDSLQLAELFNETGFNKFKLKEARIGKSKTDCDPVDLDLDIYQTMVIFGSYLQFIVSDCVCESISKNPT